jgi:GDP-4-dehydro-6-deoxy-D-mannose reductase
VRVLIAGATGFVGGHLLEYLSCQPTLTLIGVARHVENLLPKLRPKVSMIAVDLRRAEAVTELLDQVQPDLIFNLAGQAFVPAAWEHPWQSFETNVLSQLNLLKSTVELGLRARILCVSSSKAYGRTLADENPVSETHPLLPDSPYGVSKAAQDLVAYQYFLSHEVQAIRVRPFNHHGPRQSPNFVSSNFARQIAEVEAGLREPVVRVGNLDAERDFTDVADVVRAYVALIEHGEPGEAYNVGSGRPFRIRTLLDELLRRTDFDIRIEQDLTRLRPVDQMVSYADIGKIHTATGWTPQIPLEDSLKQILDYWRDIVAGRTM